MVTTINHMQRTAHWAVFPGAGTCRLVDWSASQQATATAAAAAGAVAAAVGLCSCGCGPSTLQQALVAVQLAITACHGVMGIAKETVAGLLVLSQQSLGIVSVEECGMHVSTSNA
jgi:hypothetical protein